MPKFFLTGLSKLKSKCHDDFFESDVETAFCLSSGTYWGLFFERVAISHVSCLLDFIVFGISSKIFGSVVENGIHRSWETNWRRKALQNTWEYLIIISVEQLNLGLSGRKLSTGPPKFVFMGTVGEFEELLWNFLPFFIILWLSVPVFRTFVKNCFSGRAKNDSTWPQDCATFRWKKIQRRCQTCILPIQCNLLGVFFWKDCTFTTFLDFEVFNFRL